MKVLWIYLKIYLKIGAWYVTEPSEPTSKVNWWHGGNQDTVDCNERNVKNPLRNSLSNPLRSR